MPTVSVIIPVYNRDKIIIETLELLTKQNYRPLEIIIIDDASTDNTIELINLFIKNNLDKKLNIIFHSNKSNLGACYCRNYGIFLSTGKYVQFLDSDDWLDPEKIRLQVNALENSNSSLAISDYQYLKDEKIIKACKNNGNLFKKASLGWSIYTSSPLIRTNLIKNKIKWNEKILFLQDKDFLFKVLMLSGSYIYIPGFTSNYLQHDENQISDLYLIKKPQFLIMIVSRAEFLLSNFFKLKLKCILYSILGILEIFYRSIFFYIKKSFKILLGEKNFYKLKKFLNK
jgi:glycosyltransferase involved in cell wall biosynthesis